MSNLETESGLTLSTSFALHPAPPPPPINFSALQSDSQDQNWHLHPPSAFPAFRKAAQQMRMYLPRAETQPRSSSSDGTAAKKNHHHLDQWVRFHPDGQPGSWTNDSLGFVVDMFPPIVEEILKAEEKAGTTEFPTTISPREVEAKRGPGPPKARFWYPTLSLNLDVKKKLPEPEGVEWLFIRVQAQVVRNERMDLQVLVLDTEGEMVAVSSHAGLIMGTERNMAGRRSKI